MSTIYANDFAGLTAAKQSADRTRQAGFQASVGNLVQSLQAAQNRKLSERQLDQSKNAESDRNAIAQAELLQRQKESDRNYLLDIGKNTIDKGKLELERSRFNFEKTVPKPTQEREYQLLLNTADQEASEGGIEDEKDFASKYPSLPAGLGRVFAQKSQAVRPMIEAQYRVAASLASALNERDTTKKQIDDLTTVSTGPGRNRILANSDAVNQALEALKPGSPLLRKYQVLTQTIPDKKEWQGMVYFDPKAGGYQPATPAPRWMQRDEQAKSDRAASHTGDGQLLNDISTGGGNTSGFPTNPPRSMMQVGDSQPAKTAASEPMVRMRARDGNVWNIPQSRVPEAAKRGLQPVDPGNNLHWWSGPFMVGGAH